MEDEQNDHVARLFTVKIWSESDGERVERRGNVRDVASGAFRNFRTWADLNSFLDEQLEDDGNPHGGSQ